MSERRDSNPESLAPKASMLAVTPRSDFSSRILTVAHKLRNVIRAILH
jgi:hypothetical protein